MNIELAKIGHLIGEALRILFPGVLALLLYVLGRPNNFSPLRTIREIDFVTAGAFAAVIGIIVHGLIRCGLFDLVIGFVGRHFCKLIKWPMPDIVAGSRAKFVVWRFWRCADDQDQFQTYITRRWSWVHALTSAAIIIPIFCSHPDDDSFLDRHHPECMILVSALITTVILECGVLWAAEAEWYTQKKGVLMEKEEDSINKLDNKLTTAIILITGIGLLLVVLQIIQIFWK